MRRIVLGLALLLAAVSVRPVDAQQTATKPTFYIFVDTLNVAAVAPDIYVTWIFAASVPHPTPMVSSAIQVAFDCKARLVARQYHVVYHLNADSSGVAGLIEADPGTWVEPQARYSNMFDMVCAAGAKRPYDPTAGQLIKPEPGQEQTGPMPNTLYPVS